MQPSQQHSRINLADLKAQIVKKLGPERSKLYFHYLNGLLSLKLSKGEFDKLCYRTLGRENLPLHNQLIRSILKNVCHSKVPPSVNEKEVRKSAVTAGKKSPPREDGYKQSGPPPTPTHSPTPVIWSNGDVPANVPRKGMSGIRERKLKDRPSLLGPNGKVEFPSQQSINTDESIKVIMENGDLYPCDFQRPVHHHQGLAEQPENEREVSLQRPIKKPRIKRSQDDLVSVHSKGQLEVVAVEDGEEVEQANISSSTRSPLTAPLGIPFCPASIGGARRAQPVPSSSFASYYDSGGLSDTDTLRKRMERIAGTQGLEGVSTDSANLLNNGLDAYLKRLIRSCIELVGARSGHEPSVQSVYKKQPQGKVINGIWLGSQSQMQSSSGPLEGGQEQRSCCPISLLDFKVAMGLNPQQLGEDWPLLLEKICMHSVEE
ncbi:uncharacterized protein LOC122669443 [Telopea speciosissima]|uniref:uncharacterized protein LOC122669443 n=1 Tax=Telopea speciosissima TaxID=54955 RepID=UPI001CC72189|nr:uncharacterized protein LOC122669443 [Telopea speciosissima]XP_043722144.1 uncharacterized protein LOC122669443 [Telopea speciosissima]